MNISVNLWSVLIAAVAAMVVGYLWYGPLFGRRWMHYMGWTKESMAGKAQGMGGKYLLGFIGALVTAYVLAHFVVLLKVTSMAGAWQLAFWAWLGFFATRALSAMIWEGKPFGLYVLNVLHDLVALAVMAAVLVRWM